MALYNKQQFCTIKRKFICLCESSADFFIEENIVGVAEPEENIVNSNNNFVP